MLKGHSTRGIISNTSLTVINLNFNEIGDEPTEEIGE